MSAMIAATYLVGVSALLVATVLTLRERPVTSKGMLAVAVAWLGASALLLYAANTWRWRLSPAPADPVEVTQTVMIDTSATKTTP